MAHNVWDLEAEQIGQAPGGEWLCPLPSALCPLSLLRTTAALPAAALAACTLQRGHRPVPFPLLVPFQTPLCVSSLDVALVMLWLRPRLATGLAPPERSPVTGRGRP